MAISTNGYLSSWDVVLQFEARLKAGLTEGDKPPAGFVRISGTPDIREAGAYKAEEGVHLFVRAEDPIVNDGASRTGARVRRVIEVDVVTVSNQDRAGSQRIATEKHLGLVDLVVDVMSQTPPYNSGENPTWNTPVGITCKWIPGGNEISRARKADPSRFVSTHLFELVYAQRQRVNL